MNWKCNQRQLEHEVYETLRKAAWAEFFLKNPQNRNKISLYDLVGWMGENKGSIPPHAPRRITHELPKIISTQSANDYQSQTSSVNTSKVLRLSFWRKLIERTNGFRYVQCDKNLGGMLITKEEYHLLAQREALNYENRILYVENLQQFHRLSLSIQDDLSKLNTVMIQYAEEHKIKSDTLVKEAFSDIRDIVRKGMFSPNTRIPRMKMLIKTHKGRSRDGMHQIRPIIPNCCLPHYQLGKFLGFFLAKFQKLIPWILEDSVNFRTWLTDNSRNVIATFDFTNLYGNEPVIETIKLFDDAMKGFLHSGMFRQANENDLLLLRVLILNVVQYDVAKQFLDDNHAQALTASNFSLLSFMVFIVCRETVCYLETNNDEFTILKTAKFMAMGSPPVAPISNLTLAWIEYNKLGKERCITGLRRLIDDISIDTSIISAQEILSIYPDYLTLNPAGDQHFLDVSFLYTKKGYITWPFIKPFGTIPLNVNSFHPQATKSAAAGCELRRLHSLCSHPEMKEEWTRSWEVRYQLAGYNTERIKRSFNITRIRPKENKRIHIETWKGHHTSTAQLLHKAVSEEEHFERLRSTFSRFLTAWRQPTSLQNLLQNSLPKPSQPPVDFSLITAFHAHPINWNLPDGGPFV